MKQQHKKRLILVCLMLLAGGFFLYRPMKEDHIYQRELKLVNEQNESLSLSDEEKLIKRAKASLEEYTTYTMQEDQYDATVVVEPYGSKLSSIASVIISNKQTHALMYSVGYDTSTGILTRLYAPFPEPSVAVELDLQTLEKKAKDFFFQVNDTEEKDIQYEASFQNGLYVADVLLKKDYQRFLLYLNSETGDVLLYESYTMR